MRSTNRVPAAASIEFGGTLQTVKVTWEAYFSCTSHALSAEKVRTTDRPSLVLFALAPLSSCV
jgi:hypothetical protein